MDLREEIIVNIKFTYHVSLPDLDNGKCSYAGGLFKHHLHFFLIEFGTNMELP